MYQKFLPDGSIGIQVFPRSNFDAAVFLKNILDDVIVHGHTVEVPNLDNAVVVNHTLIID